MNEVATKALAIAEALCKRFEGLFLAPYLCPAGIPSIGFGSTFYEDGTRVQLTDAPITPERALSLLRLKLSGVYMPGARRLCPATSRNAKLQGALSDFAYNLGLTRLAGSTLRRKINKGDWAGAHYEIMRWVHGGGRTLPGLVKRRAAEAALLP